MSATVLYFNYIEDDRIHVNCSRDVEIARCRIETGDDSIVVRANSAPLRENRACERVRVSDCTLRSLFRSPASLCYPCTHGESRNRTTIRRPPCPHRDAHPA